MQPGGRVPAPLLPRHPRATEASAKPPGSSPQEVATPQVSGILVVSPRVAFGETHDALAQATPGRDPVRNRLSKCPRATPVCASPGVPWSPGSQGRAAAAGPLLIAAEEEAELETEQFCGGAGMVSSLCKYVFTDLREEGEGRSIHDGRITDGGLLQALLWGPACSPACALPTGNRTRALSLQGTLYPLSTPARVDFSLKSFTQTHPVALGACGVCRGVGTRDGARCPGVVSGQPPAAAAGHCRSLSDRRG